MSKGYSRNNETYDCPHSETIDDDREGECICLQCGLVLEPLYQIQKPEATFFTDPQSDLQEISQFLQNVGAHGNIPQSVLTYTMSYFKKIKKQLVGKKKFKDKDLASYALLETLCRHKIPRTVIEISYLTQTDTNKLFSIETALNINETLSHPQDYSDRFCTLLGLSFCDSKIIKKIVLNMCHLGNANARPQTIVALVVYLYCKEKDIIMPLTKICEICSVSSANIYKLARNVQEPYKSKITLMLILS
jgi:transcription initiation factor TFIIIB Brf1 subunit/transcription initiation factor TFIIB